MHQPTNPTEGMRIMTAHRYYWTTRQKVAFWTITALALILLPLGAIAYTPTSPTIRPTTPMATIYTTNTQTRITEDDPRWNCLTMGNRTCGAGTTISPTLGDYLNKTLDGDVPLSWGGCYFLNPKEITCPSQGYSLRFH